MTTKGRVYYPLIRYGDVAFFKSAADREEYAVVVKEHDRLDYTRTFPTRKVVFSACTQQIRLVTGIKITSKTDTVRFGAEYTE